MKTAKQVFDKHYEMSRNVFRKSVIELDQRQTIFDAMNEFANLQTKDCLKWIAENTVKEMKGTTKELQVNTFISLFEHYKHSIDIAK